MNTKITITIEADCKDLHDAEIVATSMACDARNSVMRFDAPRPETQNCQIEVNFTSTKKLRL